MSFFKYKSEKYTIEDIFVFDFVYGIKRVGETVPYKIYTNFISTFIFINDEEITFDLSTIPTAVSNTKMPNSADVRWNKFVIDFGDGTSAVLVSEPLKPNRSSISSLEPDWRRVTHRFSANDTNNNTVRTVTVTVFNTYGDLFAFSFNYTIKKNSIHEIGGDFSMITANLTNDKRMSAVVRHKNTDSIIVLGEKNWKEKN